MIYSQYFEIVNALSASIGFWVILVLLRILYLGFRNSETNRIYYQLTIGIIIYVFGETALRTWSWYARAASADGMNTLWMYQSPVLLILCFFSVLGGLCMSRVMTSKKFGIWRWLAPLIFSIFFTSWSLLGDQRWH